ncbi:MAG: hypothetical protein JRN67_04920 [Nitrososphaerota archaeon]|nr:hypothetical protein [Nitrososphaerota archaeon]
MSKWFRLPQLGKEVFSDLMKAKVKYDSKFGFQFTSATNIPRALAIISDATGQEAELARSCFICDNPIDEDEATICGSCIANENAYDLYQMKFARLMETV